MAFGDEEAKAAEAEAEKKAAEATLALLRANVEKLKAGNDSEALARAQAAVERQEHRMFGGGPNGVAIIVAGSLAASLIASFAQDTEQSMTTAASPPDHIETSHTGHTSGTRQRVRPTVAGFPTEAVAIDRQASITPVDIADFARGGLFATKGPFLEL